MAKKAAVQSAVDKRFGYEFGCDGLVSMSEARKLLGGVSRDTVKRLGANLKIRLGKSPNLIMVCARSLREYIKSLEA